MESSDLQATIINGSAAMSVRGEPSVDVSRANVDFVVGDRPKFADETASLLRGRLHAAVLALTVILSAAFAGNLLRDTYSLWGLRAAFLTLLVGCWMALRSRRSWSLMQLRAIEATVFGVVVVQVAAMMWTRMAGFAEDGDATSVIAMKHMDLGAWCVLILVYGIFMPNTWKRGAAMMLPVALVPYIMLMLQRWLAPEVATILTTDRVAAPIPLPLVAALVGIYGRGQRVIEFDHDCREGICGTCGVVINGRPHGPNPATTTCQLHMRSFADGDRITVEPFRASSFPIVRDLRIDRSALDRIQQAGGFISTNIRTAPEANSILIARQAAKAAFSAAACIGCGACVASCRNAAASLFTAAKVSHLAHLPQGKTEGATRVVNMVQTMDAEGFGSCTNTEACEAVCPQEITTDHIARMNSEYLWTCLRTIGRPP